MLELRRSSEDEISTFVEFEQNAETAEFIIPYSLAQHQQAISNKQNLYLSIYLNKQLVGFFILGIGANGNIEFRRIVITAKGQGIGQKSIALMEKYCKQNLSAKRIWLDVFSFNQRGLHIYQKLGYKKFATSEHQGKELLLLEKLL